MIGRSAADIQSRRNWLKSLGITSASATVAAASAATAGNLLLGEYCSGQDNPATQVEDRSSTIKLTRLTATPFAAKVYLKLETNHGITGWGEIDQLEPTAATALAKSLWAILEGENPTRIEHLWQKLFRAHRDMRGGPFMVHTIAGFDMALWDIAGKLWNTPVYRLLGGPTRDKLKMYPAPKAEKTGAGPAPFSGNPNQIERYVEMIASRPQAGRPRRHRDVRRPLRPAPAVSDSARLGDQGL